MLEMHTESMIIKEYFHHYLGSLLLSQLPGIPPAIVSSASNSQHKQYLCDVMDFINAVFMIMAIARFLCDATLCVPFSAEFFSLH